MSAFDTIAFDLDGTLADTAPDIARSLNHALDAIGRAPIDVVTVRTMIGDGARNLIRRALAATGGGGPALVDRLYPLYVAHYAAHPCTGTAPYPGVEAALDRLAARGARLALCTNKPGEVTAALLEALGWAARFGTIVSGDTLPVRKPDPAPLLTAIDGGRHAAFIGDSAIDAATARAARIPFVAVSFGFSELPADKLGADAVIDHFDELNAALAAIARAVVEPN